MKRIRGHWVWKGSLLLLVAVVLYALALPNLSVYRRDRIPKNECIFNLKQIDGAIQQWALENKKLDSDVPELAAAAKYLKGGELPKCPHGGSYSAGKTVADAPKCSLGATLGHSLP